MFLRLHEGREDQIDWDKCPPEAEDFPDDVQKAILCYNKFPDRIVADIGFLGKDFSTFDIFVRLEHVVDEKLFFDTLLQLDRFYIEKSRKDMEAARKKAASRGKK